MEAAVKRVAQPGDPVPAVTLRESPADQYNAEGHCPLAPKPVDLRVLIGDKKTVVFGVPGAFTGTCSAKHLPGYLAHLEALTALGVEQVLCVAVNDGWVMHEWGRSQNALGKIRFLGDGEGELAKALGIDNVSPGMGLRCRRFSMLVHNGLIQQFNVEQPGQFTVSSAEAMVASLSSKH